MPDARYGCENMVAKLERVLVRRPEEAACGRWLEYGWRSAPDFAKLLHEHDGLCALLESAGAEIVFGGPVPLGLDAIYTFDPAIVSRRGAIVLRPGKDLRLPEAAATADDLAAAGIPLVATLEAPASADGGDTIWLDGRTLLVGRGYRTNEAGGPPPPGGRPRRGGVGVGPAGFPRSPAGRARLWRPSPAPG